MKTQNSYSCFSENGETCLPKTDEILIKIESGVEPKIFIDSCVCLHIIKVVDYGKKATNIDFSKIIALKEYLQNSPITISPFFALLELSLKEGNFNKDKFLDFKHRIDFFEQIPIKEFRKFKFDYNRDYLILKDISTNLHNPYKAIEPSLLNSYCALLKMRSIAQRGLTKNMAETNIYSFLDWMTNELNSIRGVEYKLALNIFGGNSVYRKMIGLDCKTNEVKKKLFGSAWDIFHSKTTANSFRLFQMFGENFSPYFLTSDANLFNLYRNLNLTLIKDGGENFTSSFLMNSDFSFPHLEIDFIDKQNTKMMDLFLDRRNNEYNFDRTKVTNLIQQLELENNVI